MVHVLLKRGLTDQEFLVRYTNAPWLVGSDGLFLRDDKGNPLVWDQKSKAQVNALEAGIAPALFHENTVMSLAVKRYLDDEYSPQRAAAICGVPARLLASVAHLASPKNAWRSFSRFRTSWLSREAVFAVLLYPVVLAWLLKVPGAGYAVLAWVVLFCTAMIYASLKPIREWRSPLVPLNYFLLGHLSGALIALAITADRVFLVPSLLVVLA